MIKFTSIIISFFLSLSIFAQEGKTIDGIVAVVGDEIVTKAELESQYLQMKTQGGSTNSQSKCLILEELMFQKLLLNQAKIDSIEITSAQVDSELDRRLRYFINQIGSEEALEEYYKKSISKIRDEMRGSLREQLLIQSMQANITEGLKITPSEVNNFFQKIPKDSLPLINSEVEIAEIVVYAPLSEESKKLTIDKLNNFRKRVEEGEKFSTLAVLYSEDRGSAKKGGEIGFVGRAEVEPEFSAAAFKLKPGQISPVVQTRHGFHLIEMIERRGEKINVRHILLKPKVDDVSFEKAKKLLDSIANLIQLDSLSFEEAAVQFSENEESRNNEGLIVNPYTGSSKVEMDELDIAIFTVIDNLEVGEISEPVLLSSIQEKPGYRIVKLKNRSVPHRANLHDDYQKIKNAALSEKEGKVLNDWLESNVSSTYVKIDDEYSKSCKFKNDWQEQNP